MPKHAYLSASASHRWLACPPSAKLCANIADQTSEYAQQGTDCHELCAYLVEKALGRAVTDPTENLTFYDAEMQNCAEEYRNYVLEQIETAKEFCKDPQVMIEQRLDFSRWVENGFGTGDCVIVADEVLQIIDYKHGLGVLVSAGDEEHGGNSQMMCYALGALEAFGDIYDINQIQMTIFQPRRDNVSTYTISKDDLLKWADEVLAPTAQLPSGRTLSYVKPRIGENQFGGESVTYEGISSTKKWERIESYGPKFVENIVQAISRDILMHAIRTLSHCLTLQTIL